MVRLKESLVELKEVERMEFQFHYGTIKSGSWFKECTDSREFQFHYGTIKRKCKRANKRTT